MGKRGVVPYVEPDEVADPTKWPRPWMGPFLARLAEMPNVGQALKPLGVGLATAYAWREKSKRFAKAWADAIEIGVSELEMAAWNRATSPTSPSDLLMIFLLKAYKPDVFRETKRLEVGGTPNQPMQVEVRAVDYRIAVSPLAPEMTPSELIEDADYRLLPAPIVLDDDDED